VYVGGFSSWAMHHRHYLIIHCYLLLDIFMFCELYHELEAVVLQCTRDCCMCVPRVLMFINAMNCVYPELLYVWCSCVN